MNIVAVFDSKNYEDTVSVYEKYTVRGIIRRNGKFAMQCSKEGEYKIPGGGVEQGESYTQALIREALEETGLSVIPEQITELGGIDEMRRDIFDPKKKYICHSLFYACEVEDGQAPLHLTKSEIAKGFELKWATLEEICERNSRIEKDPWIIRDTTFLKLILDGTIVLPESKC